MMTGAGTAMGRGGSGARARAPTVVSAWVVAVTTCSLDILRERSASKGEKAGLEGGVGGA